MKKLNTKETSTTSGGLCHCYCLPTNLHPLQALPYQGITETAGCMQLCFPAAFHCPPIHSTPTSEHDSAPTPFGEKVYSNDDYYEP